MKTDMIGFGGNSSLFLIELLSLASSKHPVGVVVVLEICFGLFDYSQDSVRFPQSTAVNKKKGIIMILFFGNAFEEEGYHINTITQLM